MPLLKGVYTAIVTPFHEDGTLNEEGLQSNIQFQISQGVQGITVLGTTGETPTLAEQEKVRVLQIAKEECSGRIHLMAGTGNFSTEQTIRMSRLAEELGADSCLVITPYYNKPNQEGIYQHFKAVAESVHIPVILYHHPGRSGCRIAEDTLLRLAEITNIAGIKDASADLATLTTWLEKVDPQFSFLSGDDLLTLPMMAIGGRGVISVASNILPREMVDMVGSALQGDFLTARDLHYHLLPLMQALSIDSNPIPVKAAMNHIGQAAGPCRLPLTPLTDGHLKLLKETLPKVVHG